MLTQYLMWFKFKVGKYFPLKFLPLAFIYHYHNLNNFKKHFWQLGKISLPLTLATAASTLLVLIDSFFATRVSIESYEAIFLTLPIMGIGNGIGIGLAAAIADLVSKEKEIIQIKRLVAASFVLAGISILIFLYFGLFQTDLIERTAGLNQLNADSLITQEFRNYWSVILWTFPVQILFSLTIQFLTILEKQKVGTKIVIAMLLLNVVLDYAFTQILPWGVEGLAYSTMGVFSAGVLLSVLPLKRERYFQLPYPNIFNKKFLTAFSQLTFTTFLIFLSIVIFVVMAIVLNKMALEISTSALVIYAVFRQIMEVIIITTRGLSGGFIIYLGNALRDKSTQDYFSIYWAATAWIAVTNLTGAFLMLAFPTRLINFFENIDLALYPDIVYALMLGALILFVFVLPRMGQIGFISLNKPVLLVSNSVVFVVIQLAAAFYWVPTYGVFGLVYAELAACILSGSIFLPLFFYHLNKAKKADLRRV